MASRARPLVLRAASSCAAHCRTSSSDADARASTFAAPERAASSSTRRRALRPARITAITAAAAAATHPEATAHRRRGARAEVRAAIPRQTRSGGRASGSAPCAAEGSLPSRRALLGWSARLVARRQEEGEVTEFAYPSFLLDLLNRVARHNKTNELLSRGERCGAPRATRPTAWRAI